MLCECSLNKLMSMILSIYYNFKGSTWKEYKVESLLEQKEMDSGPCEAMGRRSRRERSEYLLF